MSGHRKVNHSVVFDLAACSYGWGIFRMNKQYLDEKGVLRSCPSRHVMIIHPSIYAFINVCPDLSYKKIHIYSRILLSYTEMHCRLGSKEYSII